MFVTSFIHAKLATYAFVFDVGEILYLRFEKWRPLFKATFEKNKNKIKKKYTKATDTTRYFKHERNLTMR